MIRLMSEDLRFMKVFPLCGGETGRNTKRPRTRTASRPYARRITRQASPSDNCGQSFEIFRAMGSGSWPRIGPWVSGGVTRLPPRSGYLGTWQPWTPAEHFESRGHTTDMTPGHSRDRRTGSFPGIRYPWPT